MSPQSGAASRRGRIREIIPQLQLGKWPPGRLNSITDVPGVLVHTESLQPDQDVNTGVTIILPRPDWHHYSSFAGVFSFNGCGEMTGTHWIDETGLLTMPIVLTTTSSVGDAFRGTMEYAVRNLCNEQGEMDLFVFPLVAETFDGFLNNQTRFALTPEHVVNGIKNATADRVPEGNTGGGTGMICHRFKGGTGSSSRIIEGVDVDGNPKQYTVGVLVQANYGKPENLNIGGIPVGRILEAEKASAAEKATEATAKEPRKDGSIIVIVATDVPLLPIQLQRLAKRATIGLGKVGGYGNNSSGDIFLAFSTANKIPYQKVPMGEEPSVNPYCPQPKATQMLDNDSINGVFEATADATEEAIYNAMFMAETLTGFKGRTVDALDLVKVKQIVEKRL